MNNAPWNYRQKWPVLSPQWLLHIHITHTKIPCTHNHHCMQKTPSTRLPIRVAEVVERGWASFKFSWHPAQIHYNAAFKSFNNSTLFFSVWRSNRRNFLHSPCLKSAIIVCVPSMQLETTNAFQRIIHRYTYVEQSVKPGFFEFP